MHGFGLHFDTAGLDHKTARLMGPKVRRPGLSASPWYNLRLELVLAPQSVEQINCFCYQLPE